LGLGRPRTGAMARVVHRCTPRGCEPLCSLGRGH